ncbi:MAG: hypothetical protein ACLFVR_16520 [Thiohalospira sp.]
MSILIDLNHPSHVHTFRDVIARLKKRGHFVFVAAADKDVTRELLEDLGIAYVATGTSPASKAGKVFQALKKIWVLVRITFTKKVDLVVSMESPYAAIAGWLCRKRVITFADTETAGFIHRIIRVFSSTIIVPSCFEKQIAPRQIKFNGYKELAYLHPSVFTATREVVEACNINPEKPYALIRFVAYQALHDINHKGFTEENKLKLVRGLEKKMKVYISSERRPTQLHENSPFYQGD